MQGHALTSMPIPSSSKWNWTPLDHGSYGSHGSLQQPPTSTAAPLFLEPAHLPDFGLAASPADTSPSLQSAAQRQNDFDAGLRRRSSTPPAKAIRKAIKACTPSKSDLMRLT